MNQKQNEPKHTKTTRESHPEAPCPDFFTLFWRPLRPWGLWRFKGLKASHTCLNFSFSLSPMSSLLAHKSHSNVLLGRLTGRQCHCGQLNFWSCLWHLVTKDCLEDSGFGPLAPGVTRFPATSPHLRGVPEYNPTTLVHAAQVGRAWSIPCWPPRLGSWSPQGWRGRGQKCVYNPLMNLMSSGHSVGQVKQPWGAPRKTAKISVSPYFSARKAQHVGDRAWQRSLRETTK